MFKGTMTKWPVQKLTQGTAQKTLTTSIRNRHLENIYFCVFSDFTFAAITEDTFPLLLSSKNMNIKDESSGNFLLFLIISFLKQDLNTFHIKGM